ncbi:MAG: imidazole glycerol phosphate synthase subunit HisH, partial [Gemmatimonadales bacterium]|nr:imidazole glycerol phosphate synthase subunit HisH [Gemmatimonadales bacterium]
MIAVVDYGVNNLKSVVRALEAGGHRATLTTDPEAVRTADRVLVPGVGNFGQGSRNLAETGLGEAVREAAG